MFQWLKNRRKTEQEPPTPTELIARMVELEGEWQAFLEMQARIARRTAKREKDEVARQARAPIAPEPVQGDPREFQKAQARERARQMGLIGRNHVSSAEGR